MHVSDGILAPSVCAAGYVAAGGLVLYGIDKARDADVPRAGLLTAAFFLAGLIRIPLPGTSVHLILGSLNGIALGALCFPSIFLALLLQAVLLGHGGVSTLGVNTLIMATPAYLAGQVFHKGMAQQGSGWPLFTISLAAICVLGPKLFFDGLYVAGITSFELSWIYIAPTGIIAALALALLLGWLKPLSPLYRWGFSTGSLTVVLSGLLFYLALAYAPLAGHAARDGFSELARFAFLSHIPIMVGEGIVVALLIKYLDTVSPELLRMKEKGRVVP